jgi:hypothetical protein
MPENKELELKDFTLKTAALMVLTSAARASEICSLKSDYMQISQNEVSFTQTSLTKRIKVKDTCNKVTFCAYENKNWM